MKIGYVGLGAMGSSLAKWLISDFDLSVWDLNPATLERFSAEGAKAAGSLAELARETDIIFLCLPRSADVEAAIFGPNGLAGGLSAGKLIVDQTSGVAKDTMDIASRLAEIGVAMLDAPVAGGVGGAKAGTITIMVSGPDDAFERAMPAFKAMTSKIYRASNRVGDAQSVKTLNNMMNMVFRVATLELAALASKLGLSLPDLTKTLIASEGGNFTTRTVLPAIIESRTTGDFALTLMLKDNNQALTLGREAGVPMPLSSVARGVLQHNIHVIGSHSGLDDVIVYMEKITGASFADGLGAAKLEKAEEQRLTTAIVTALAACNRVAGYEIFSVASALGMKLGEFGEIVNNGSAWSRECENILAELGGAGIAQTRTLSEAINALREVERLGISKGVAMLEMGAVRALCEAAANSLGHEALLDALAGYFEQQAGVSLSV